MNLLFLLAAALVGILGVGHSYLGERYILIRLFKRGELPRIFGNADFTKATLRFAWHITTVAWIGLAGLLVAQALSPAPRWSLQGQVIAATFALSGVVAFVGSRGRHLSWIVFFAVAGRVWLGLG